MAAEEKPITKSEDQRQSLSSVSGTVKRIVFRAKDSGFNVLLLEAQGFVDPIKVVGQGPELNEGEVVTATGKWRKHKKFGRQFSAELIHPSQPSTESGMKTYLSSKAIDGIGEVYAEKLVKTFGDQLFNVVEFEPKRLLEVSGIGKKRAQKIKETWDRDSHRRDTLLFLHNHGIGGGLANRIYQAYGQSTIKKVAKNPYQLSRDIRGVGFRTADTIALKTGFEPNDIRRVRAGLLHLLGEAANQGNCGMSVAELADGAAELLGINVDLANEGIDAEFEDGGMVKSVIEENKICAFLPEIFLAEEEIANRVKALREGHPPWKTIDCDLAIPWVERDSEFELGDSQEKAIRVAVSEKFTVITGGPGVGKTTIVNAILKILSAVNVKINLCAPTGRAARRMSEATGRRALTVHRLLQFEPKNGRFHHDSDSPLKCDLLIVDEASMVDASLMSALLSAVPSHAAVILVGDVDQLPSVGPGRVLGDIIDSACVPVFRLIEVFRQAAASRIILNAHRINSGTIPDLGRPAEGSDFYFVPAEEPEDAVEKVLKLVCERIPDRFGMDPVRDTQVLCPMIRGSVGVQSLNRQLQNALNPDRQKIVERYGRSYGIGDKVMQTHNNYEDSVFNGDIGFVVDIDADNESVNIDFDGRLVKMEFNNLDGVMPAYAVTIHKSQGSEFPAVVIPIMNQHYVMLKRKLLYTGVTRGKNLVVLVGQSEAIRIAVHGRSSGRPRLSRLKSLL